MLFSYFLVLAARARQPLILRRQSPENTRNSPLLLQTKKLVRQTQQQENSLSVFIHVEVSEHASDRDDRN